MREVVKEFIEAAITDIEQEDYYEVFTIWYLHFSEKPKSRDVDNLNELFTVFDSVGIDLYNKSEEARKEILHDHMWTYMEDIINDNPDVKEITLPNVINSLESKLGIDLININKIFKSIATDLAKIYNLQVASFKLIRK